VDRRLRNGLPPGQTPGRYCDHAVPHVAIASLASGVRLTEVGMGM
jgi:hypothetical protein